MVEWFVAGVSLIALAPLLAILALAVKLHSPGPAFYSQIRLGRGGRPFRIFKFRTMTHNCEAATGAVWAKENDPRITPLGRLLRDTHLDELPQLWNVLRCEMSLIGPRPERPELAREIERVIPNFASRLRIRPGLTGLAQMRLPADREMNDVGHKLQQDLLYIDRIGLLMDLRIVLCTVLTMLEAACQSSIRLMLGEYRVEPKVAQMSIIPPQDPPTAVDERGSEREEKATLLAA